MPPDDALYLGHMLEHALSAIEKVGGKSRAEFDADETLRLALVRLIEVIGEAARRRYRDVSPLRCIARIAPTLEKVDTR